MPTELPALNACEPRWHRQAVRLARSRTPFAVTNFNAARDGNFYFAIRNKYQLSALIDYEAAKANFQPSASATPPVKQRVKFRVSKSLIGSGVQVNFSGLRNANKPAR